MTQEKIMKLAKKLEFFESPQWAVDRILEKEILTKLVIDPCAGTGIMAETARAQNYDVVTCDVHNWGYDHLDWQNDFLTLQKDDFEREFSIFMNPPFSLACEFVEKSFELGARKIVMFQRWAFKESAGRREFLEKNPMARMYLCGDRATCWLHGLPINAKGKRYNPETGKEYAGTSTAHGFFVWERGQEQSNPPTFMLYK